MEEKFNYKPYLLAALSVLLFSIFAPIIFTKCFSGISFGTETGVIGDTIGGVTAPFLSLVGSILVYTTLRAQIQANAIVIKQIRKEGQTA